MKWREQGELQEGLRALLLFLFVALLVVVPWAHWGMPLLGLALFVPCTVAMELVTARSRHAGRAPASLERDDWLLVVVLLAYGGLWLLDVARSGHWPLDSPGWAIPLPFWPWLAALLLIWFLRHPPGVRAFWVAVCCGALGAGTIALHERLVLGNVRASNGLNAIPFGNLALLLGGLSLLALLWCLPRRPARSRMLACLALLAGLMGILGSLLSGTRGGWLALPFLLALWLRTSRGLLQNEWRYLSVGLVAMLIIGAALLPSSNVTPRLALAVSEVQQFRAGETHGSVGMRLEMWRSALMLWSEKPLLGWGEGGVVPRVHALINDGQLSPLIKRFGQLHSDIIDTAARRGLVGVTMLLMLYGIPLWLFWRRLRSAGPVEVQLMAGAGMMLCVAYIDFGLSQSMLRDSVGLSGYLGLCLACWVSLRASELAWQQEREVSLGHFRHFEEPT